MAAGSVVVNGLPELVAALRAVEPEVLPELKRQLGDVGDVIREEARSRFEHIDAKTADGFETRVRTGGASAVVVVAQSLRKTTGRRPDYGATQVRYLLRARSAKYDQAVETLEHGAADLLRQHGFSIT